MDELTTPLFLAPQMSLTRTDSLDREKPYWLTQMEAVLEVLNEGVIIATDTHRILLANSRFLEMTGISLQDLVEFDPLRFYSWRERDFLKQQIDVAFRATFTPGGKGIF